MFWLGQKKFGKRLQKSEKTAFLTSQKKLETQSGSYASAPNINKNDISWQNLYHIIFFLDEKFNTDIFDYYKHWCQITVFTKKMKKKLHKS